MNKLQDGVDLQRSIKHAERRCYVYSVEHTTDTGYNWKGKTGLS